MTVPVQPGPCEWPFADTCAAGWADLDAGVQVYAQKFASYLMWSLTGRRYGLCDVTVRPCQWQRCGAGYPPGGWWSAGSPWIPTLVDGSAGIWINSCGCTVGTMCACDAPCTVRLPGPVSSITEVKVDGAIVPADAYAVYEWKDLMRVDGDCWPLCQDWNADVDEVGSFVVTYKRGTLPPDSADCVTGILALEVAKACTGEKCRLGRNVQSLTRQGVNLQFASPQQLIELRLTGIPEVDMWIAADNPDRLTSDSVVWSPELRRGRQRTS